MVILHFGGVPLAPRTMALVLAWAHAIEQHDLDDLTPVVQRRLFGRGAITLVRDGAVLQWALTPWGELTLCELVHLALHDAMTPTRKRQAIDDTLTFAGYREGETV
jgi:hypothetical protein